MATLQDVLQYLQRDPATDPDCGFITADDLMAAFAEMWTAMTTGPGGARAGSILNVDYDPAIGLSIEMSNGQVFGPYYLGTGTPGVGIHTVHIDPNGNLILDLTDGNTIDVGYVMGPPGTRGKDGVDGKDGPIGPPGKDGKQGPPGPSPQVTTSNTSGQTPTTNPPTTANAGDWFINTTDGRSWIFNGTAWVSPPAPAPPAVPLIVPSQTQPTWQDYVAFDPTISGDADLVGRAMWIKMP